MTVRSSIMKLHSSRVKFCLDSHDSASLQLVEKRVCTLEVL